MHPSDARRTPSQLMQASWNEATVACVPVLGRHASLACKLTVQRCDTDAEGLVCCKWPCIVHREAVVCDTAKLQHLPLLFVVFCYELKVLHRCECDPAVEV